MPKSPEVGEATKSVGEFGVLREGSLKAALAN